MSFFELDGGAKKKARKSTNPKATKKAPAKKSSGKKKGGNFLGTVSELFAPAGWENFVTAAGLLALDRTDNYLRKSKDSKKQRGGDDKDVYMEEPEPDMTGGARKRSSSRKQRGGSDGHHTVETLDMLTTSGEEQDMTVQTDTTSQTGGAKKRSKSKSKSRTRSRSSSKSKPKVKKTVRKVRKQKGGSSLIEIVTRPNLDKLYNEYALRISNHAQKISSMTEPQESLNRTKIFRELLTNMNITITDDLLRAIDEYVMLRSAVKNIEKKNPANLEPYVKERYNNVKTRLDEIHNGKSASIGNASNLQTGNTGSIGNASNLQTGNTGSIGNASNLQTGNMITTLFNSNTEQVSSNAGVKSSNAGLNSLNTGVNRGATVGGKPKSTKKPKAKKAKKAPKKK